MKISNIYIYILCASYSCVVPAITLIPNDNKTIKLNQHNEDNYNYEWFNKLITSGSNNNIPTLTIGKDAAVTNQQDSILAVGEALIQKQNNINNVKDYNFLYLTKNSFSRMNVDSLGKLKNDNYDIDKLQNLSPINIFTRDNGDRNYEYNINWLKQDINKVKQLTGCKEVDLVVDELLFKSVIEQSLENPSNSLFEFIVTNSNHITVMSDGAAHTKFMVPFLIELLNGNIVEKQRAVQNLQNIKSLTSELTPKDIKDFIQLKDFDLDGKHYDDFIHFLHYDSRYIVNLNNLYNITSYDLNFFNYNGLFRDSTIANEFTNIQSNMFSNNIHNLSDIFVSGYSKYDPNKKNAIFLGSSLFIPTQDGEVTRLEHLENIRIEIQNQFNKFLKEFPEKEYNIIFKLHPRYKSTNALKYVEIITNKQIMNPIIVNPSIPFEMLLSNDFASYKNNTGTNFIFKGKTKEDAINNTKYFGFQATTSSIHTTRLFYAQSFNMSSNDIGNLITFHNFPIPTLFDIVYSETTNNSDRKYYNTNVQQLNDIYKYYNPSVLYNNPSYKQYDLFKINDLIPMGLSKDNEDKKEDNSTLWIIVGVVSSVIIILIAIFITLFVLWKKNKIFKKKKI